MSFSEHKTPVPFYDLQGELKRLADLGYALVPLGGADGKTPKLRDWAKGEVKLSQCKAIMKRTGSTTYGVRLDGIIVLDVDTNDPGLIARLEHRFGPAQVKVRSPRGMHLYYAATGAVISDLRAEGLPVDVKTGPRSYVVGPLSCRPDGGEYVYIKGPLGETILTPMRAQATAGSVAVVSRQEWPEVGQRHNWLLSQAMQMVEVVNTLDELLANLVAKRDELSDPDSMQNSEVQKIAQWAWTCRLENRVYVGRNSEVKIERLAIDTLLLEQDALALYVTLMSFHGHSPAKRFALSHDGMVKAGKTALSRDRFRAARDTLVAKGLLQMVAKHQAGKRSQQFILCRSPQVGQEQQNVTRIQFS